MHLSYPSIGRVQYRSSALRTVVSGLEGWSECEPWRPFCFCFSTSRYAFARSSFGATGYAPLPYIALRK